MRKVVVTGIGAVTPCGNTIEDTWANVKAGKSGIAKIKNFDASNFKVQIAGEIKDDFDLSKYVDSKDARKMARFSQLACAASKMALDDAKITREDLDAGLAERTGCYLGIGVGGFDVTEESFKKYFTVSPDRIPPLCIPMLIPNEGPGNICMLYGIKGPSKSLATACASGTDALGDALDAIRSGRIDVCLAGGAEAADTGFGIQGFTVLKALAADRNDDPEHASRPFDKDRSGFVLGEGAAVLILEEEEHAKARGARIYAEFAGYGATSDGYHITSPCPDGSGCAKAITLALKDAGMKPEDVDYYNAHGTSTHINDSAETGSLKMALGEAAKKLHISSTKSMTGHCLGAAGAIEAAICVKAIEDNFVPPTINLDNPDVEGGCDLDYTPNKGIETKVDVAMSGSLGFGGHNGVVIFKRYN